jgi:predicted Rossmann fold flavoprotein
MLKRFIIMPDKFKQTDVLIIGASASGLMCAIEAGKRGRNVVVLDHANKAGKKILMSGGGRCNFTNIDVDASHFISHNPHFCKSALSRYTQWDFIALVERHKIPYQQRDLGKLFCDNSAKDILDMLLDECKRARVKVMLNCDIKHIEKMDDESFAIKTSADNYMSTSLVIASGGLSIPRMCASPIGYKIAEQFGLHLWPTMAGLVPFTLQPHDKQKLEILSGISIECLVSNERIQFKENILFTHRGLSGPAILQISSYWKAGESISINLLPEVDAAELLTSRRAKQPQIKLKTLLTELLPKRLVPVLFEQKIIEQPLQNLSKDKISEIAGKLQQWKIKPNATEGYRTAEVTLGGVDCDELSSRTMASKKVKNLYFIGEVIDVTGWLGGYNFQWAWSSGWCAGQVV